MKTRIVAWVTCPERPKDAKAEVKWLEGPPARNRGPGEPLDFYSRILPKEIELVLTLMVLIQLVYLSSIIGVRHLAQMIWVACIGLCNINTHIPAVHLIITIITNVTDYHNYYHQLNW